MSCFTIAAADGLARIFPEARFVHSVRDGRDSGSSKVSLRQKPHHPTDVISGIEFWADRLRQAEEGVRGLDEADRARLRVISLDELVQSDREGAYAELLEFLGVDDEPAMREFFDAEMSADAAHRERWRKGLDEAEQAADHRASTRRRSTRLEREGYHCAPVLRRSYERTPRGLRALRVLFTTSNGTGLGHLTRSMAIARRLPDAVEPLFLTLSAAAPVVEGMGFPVEYVASYATPASGNDYRWSRRLRARLRAAIAEADPAVIVFDGAHPYEALLGALRADEHRGLVPAAAVEARLEPGAARPRGRLRRRARAGRAGRVRGRGPDGRAARPRPPGRPDRAPRPRRAARRATRPRAELGLDPGGRRSSSASARGAEVREATRRALARLAPARRGPGRGAAVGARRGRECPTASSALSATYPMSRYFAAFDGAVAAAGYNAYHELIALGVPSLFVPMPRDTDDQAARARYAERAGIGLGADGPADPELEAKLERLLDPAERGAIRDRLGALRRGRGRRRRPRPGWPSSPPAPTPRAAETQVVRETATRGGCGGVPAALGVVLRQPAADRGAADAPAAHQAAGAGAGARGRDPAERCRRGGRGRRSPRPASRRSAPWWSPTRSRRSASCARSGSGSSTCRRAGSRQAELAGGPYERVRRRGGSS